MESWIGGALGLGFFIKGWWLGLDVENYLEFLVWDLYGNVDIRNYYWVY